MPKFILTHNRQNKDFKSMIHSIGILRRIISKIEQDRTLRTKRVVRKKIYGFYLVYRFTFFSPNDLIH